MNVVLVIESDAAIRVALSDLLKLEWPHLSVVTAESGEKGLEIAQEIRPDLILLEGEMPGMDGYETAKALRDIPETKSTPLIALTSTRKNDSQVVAGLCATCNAWLLKPFSAAKLMQVVTPFASAIGSPRG